MSKRQASPQSFVIHLDTGKPIKKSKNRVKKNNTNEANAQTFVLKDIIDEPSTIETTHKKSRSDDKTDVCQKSADIITTSHQQKSVIDMSSYNIFRIDEVIREKLSANISSLDSLETDLRKLLGALIDKNVDAVTKIPMQQQITMLRNRIRDIETTFELNLYIYKTADILSKYATILESENSRNFILDDDDYNSYNESATEKTNLVARYVSIAREYVDIENYRKTVQVMACPICKGTDMTKRVDEETFFVCKCGGEIEIFDNTPSFKDTDRVNMTSRYTYTRRGHFVDAMKKYQGKHNIDAELLQSVAQKLKKEMQFYNLTPDNVTKDHLYNFLAEKKLSDCYEDINILYHIITGKECPEFSHLENSLLELFEEQEQALIEVTALDPNDERLNSINVYYKLYKLLQKLDYPCKKGDFYILKTKAKEDEHDEKMSRAWALLGWPWIDT